MIHFAKNIFAKSNEQSKGHARSAWASQRRLKAKISVGLLCLSSLMTGTAQADTLAGKFERIPDDQRVAVYWYWMSDNISVEGVQHDLEAMKRAGITRAYIGNIWQDAVKPGKIKVLTPEWWEVMHAALKRAGELDIEIGVFNCPGWSQSGGPWIKANQSMRYLKAESVDVKGNGRELIISLPSLGKEAEDVRVLAMPRHTAMLDTLLTIDKQQGKDQVTDLHLDAARTIRNITFSTSQYLLADVRIQTKQDGKYQDIKTAHLDRTNTELNVGFVPWAPISIDLPDTHTQDLRIVTTGGPRDCHFQARVTDLPRVERYMEKSLAKMYQTPLPMWGEYMWPTQQEPQGTSVTQPSQVLDLTSHMSQDGTLRWTAPKGEWTILRTGMAPTGVTNAPASKEGTGYEVDKLSREHVASHFDAFLGELLRRIPAEDRSTFKIVVEDSYETGGLNWTDDMIESFRTRYGYDPVPYIPTLYGTVIGSQDQSERFLWDLRRLVADRVAYDYVGGLREVSNRHGLTTWLECYGHWGFPSEFLMYGGQSDEVAGEFWSEGSLGDIENRAASSCAHIYGKRKVWAESCTAGGPNFSRYPAVMKQRTDRFFCEGINATLLHLFIQQPDDDTLPGVSAPFGNDFQRKNTWFAQMDLFTDYLRRCNLMLQQGAYVADVAYYIGEDAPKMTGECNPALPRGYSFDYLNAEVLHSAWVSEGRLCLAGGMTYRTLVLPDQTTMRPEVLADISRLVKDGLTVIGPKPTSSPSMQGWPEADGEVKALADQMWNGGRWGQGRVYGKGTSLDHVLQAQGIRPDCYVDASQPFAFIHRHLPGREIYFVSNQSDQPQDLRPKFRVTGMQAEVWNPVTAERMRVEGLQDDGTLSTLDLHLEGNESAFVVFAQEIDSSLTVYNPAPKSALLTISTPWQVEFQPGRRGPEEGCVMDTLMAWNQSQDDRVRYYSGIATYSNTFKLKKLPEGPTWIDLGRVMVMARVYVNDQYAGGVWTPPYRLNVQKLLCKGVNTLRVEVVNNWQNRLIGDQKLPEQERPTWTSVNPWNADSPLQDSGLLGPVSLLQ